MEEWVFVAMKKIDFTETNTEDWNCLLTTVHTVITGDRITNSTNGTTYINIYAKETQNRN